jgi:hypothetical protein
LSEAMQSYNESTANQTLPPPGTWRDALLAALPYFWPLVLLAIPALGDILSFAFQWGFFLGLLSLLLVALAVLIDTADPTAFSDWPLWSASWLGFPLAFGFFGLWILTYLLAPVSVWGEAAAFLIMTAVLLAILRRSRRAAILATLPIVGFFLGWLGLFIGWGPVATSPILALGIGLGLSATAVAAVRLRHSELSLWMLLVVVFGVLFLLHQLEGEPADSQPPLVLFLRPAIMLALVPLLTAYLLRPLWRLTQEGHRLARAGFLLLLAGLGLRLMVPLDLLYLLTGTPLGELTLTLGVALFLDLVAFLLLGTAVWQYGRLSLNLLYPWLWLLLLLTPLVFHLGSVVHPIRAVPPTLFFLPELVITTTLLQGLAAGWLLLATIVITVAVYYEKEIAHG